MGVAAGTWGVQAGPGGQVAGRGDDCLTGAAPPAPALAMEGDGIIPTLGQASTIAHELMEEDLQRELARNEAATRLAMEREIESRNARQRAQESQKKMNSMLAKYEEMKEKLSATKGHLDEKNKQISNQAKLTEQILAMKERVEAYATKKEAVSALSEHVALMQAMQQNKLEIVKEEMLDDGNASNAVRLDSVKVLSKDHKERIETLKANMQKNAETMEKREQMKAMLEKQVELEEKRAIEQNKIAQMRERMMEMKMKELALQKAKMARMKKDQEERKRATDDFMVTMEANLQEMEEKVLAPLVTERDRQMAQGAVPKQGKNKGKGKKSKSSTPKVMSPEPQTKTANDQEKGALEAAMNKSERKKEIIKRLEQLEKEKTVVEKPEERMTEDEVKTMVENAEGKCKTVRNDMADMAMSEQYLRTKQAMLMAKKKEQEMKIAANIAAIREDEVTKMREKVKAMQDLLASRKKKLQITEEILVEKSEEKKMMERNVEKMKRRESHSEKELLERVVFDKPPQKKK